MLKLPFHHEEKGGSKREQHHVPIYSQAKSFNRSANPPKDAIEPVLQNKPALPSSRGSREASKYQDKHIQSTSTAAYTCR
jgi:hypothetical protein